MGTIANDTDVRGNSSSSSDLLESTIVIKNQLAVTKNEISNLRQEMQNLKCTQEKEIETMRSAFSNVPEKFSDSSTQPDNKASIDSGPKDENVNLRYIGVISTCFQRKRGTPRQPGICMRSKAKLTLNNSFFNNPEHALVGLEEFSHLWIIFHFHRNENTHVRPKIAPPRLNGIRTGVFSTRSPVRPSPIGLSLVKIDKIEGASIYFSGVDMLDGTPVVDIKPYIPDYDDPMNLENNQSDDDSSSVSEDFNQVETSCSSSDIRLRPIPSEVPDGGDATSTEQSRQIVKSTPIIRVPSWISDPPVSKLRVEFDAPARLSLDQLRRSSSAANPEEIITKVLQEDPRSKYLRERYADQFWTFEIDPFKVRVKFDDVNHKVVVSSIVNESSRQNSFEPKSSCTNSNSCKLI